MSNVAITVIDRQGAEHNLDAPTDMNMNLMELCRSYELPVEGICGGMALCASCHVYVESSHDLPPANDAELDMLDLALAVKSNSRLGCQIPIAPDLSGLVVRLAPESL
jgi:ferredoxin